MRFRGPSWLPLAVAVSYVVVWVAVTTPAAQAVSIQWVTVGDPGNAVDTTGYGAVAGTYRIGKYEVTNTQYAGFLNAVDPSGANGLDLYHASMGSDATFGGISLVGGNPNGSKYTVKAGFATKPVVFVSFFDALRFANWLNNGQGTASTETGAYTLLGGTSVPSNWTTVTRNAGATIVLTSEDEWYKAAYYDASTAGYNPYPFADGFNGVACSSPAGTTSHSANCNGAVGDLTYVGAYTGSPSEYDTFDQGGNVWEWNETIDGLERGMRGGRYTSNPFFLSASARTHSSTLNENSSIGFRVAMIPEPGTGLLVMTGMLGLATWRRRGA